MRRRVVFVAFEGFQMTDLAGPADVFATADLLVPDGGYRTEVVAVRAGAVAALNGIPVLAGGALREVTGPIDTLIVVGGLSVPACLDDRELVGQVARLADTARRVASVCNGAFVLAEAGLLDGRRATTHWLVARDLAALYPRVEVDADPIYIRDGDVWTSAGVSAGVDLALALVADDHGHALARDVACGLVVYLHRPGGQSQFSTAMRALAPPREPFRELQAFIDAHPADDLSVPALARRTGMSERHFSRVFTAQTGLPPGRYVELSRADAARRLLEITDHPLERVARECGLGSPETLYRVFRRHWRISPGDYRRRFHLKES
ncbi:Transcriptional regulator GlxA family, contains an amidase domain and an AraC-type DNA-binding HTH domain [Thermomonospora echinospora]|uniref:Transcriptional regulator GlxA family, contains an amidase domain and an AraC-type DNA-binding HTH domain n=1 Tax=Thermomonospora echinospora TaxID=1992 RepID=A0A1H6CVS3_9ACTN|nr:GlxA family transcriptional regulator [Thermomonospora echinospora]SEG77064.1 Transcriptional regulator GlxA family, contains an amidase domain and an AraC-type DNA-binding HTH domain [Thermomonospora echinospora]